MTKYMVAGDWHGNTTWAVKMVEQAHRIGINKIIQVGDFGLWDHTLSGVKYLDVLNDQCRMRGVYVYFVDGNHENHDRLKWYDVNNPSSHQGHTYIRSHILHLPRGSRWEWDGKVFVAVGGAYSIDKAWRREGESWWVGETLTDREVEFKVPNNGDYLFTHDCPTNAPFRFRIKDDPDSHIHRQRMDQVGKKVGAKLWFHGHMHEKYEYDFRHRQGYTQVWGLDKDEEQFNWGVLDTDTDTFTWGATLRSRGQA